MRSTVSLRQRTLAGLFGLALVAGVSGCAFGGSSTSSSSGGTSGAAAGGEAIPVGTQSSWCGTISMYAQAYTPNAKVANTSNLTELQKAADAYAAKFPNCRKVSFIDDKFEDNITTIRTKAAAGDLFDIFWAQWTSFQGQLPDGVAYNLTPAMDAKSPYADAATWGDAMNKQIISDTRTGTGASYNVNGDFVANSWYYNKDLFTQAGITDLPTTWSEFTAVCQKLKAAGINPASFVPYYGWMARPFLSNIYGQDYQKMAALDGAQGFSTADEALATAQGLLSASDPKFTSWWPAFKQASDTWSPDYITANPDKNFQAEQDFLAGKSAMYFNGSYFTSKLKSAGLPFQYDSFPFPSVDQQTSQFATDIDPGDTIGGPSGAFQYAISTPKADKSMAEEGKPAAVLDWVQFLTAPKTAEAIVNESGQFLPTFAGTKPLPEFEKVADQISKPARTIRVGYTAPSLDNDDQTIFGAYLGGQISLDDAKSQLEAKMTAAAQDYIKKNNLSTTGAAASSSSSGG